MVGVDDLPRRVIDSAESTNAAGATYYELVNDAKRQIIMKAMEQSRGNYTEAAKALEIHPNNLHRIIRSLDLKAALAKWA
jgi:transcriptional regulator with GAF, ATPase, and Fis domain